GAIAGIRTAVLDNLHPAPGAPGQTERIGHRRAAVQLARCQNLLMNSRATNRAPAEVALPAVEILNGREEAGRAVHIEDRDADLVATTITWHIGLSATL